MTEGPQDKAAEPTDPTPPDLGTDGTQPSTPETPTEETSVPPDETGPAESVPDEPVADEPVADEPVADEPVADEPVADESVSGDPVADEDGPAAEVPGESAGRDVTESAAEDVPEAAADDPTAEAPELEAGGPGEAEPEPEATAPVAPDAGLDPEPVVSDGTPESDAPEPVPADAEPVPSGDVSDSEPEPEPEPVPSGDVPVPEAEASGDDAVPEPEPEPSEAVPAGPASDAEAADSAPSATPPSPLDEPHAEAEEQPAEPAPGPAPVLLGGSESPTEVMPPVAHGDEPRTPEAPRASDEPRAADDLRASGDQPATDAEHTSSGGAPHRVSMAERTGAGADPGAPTGLASTPTPPTQSPGPTPPTPAAAPTPPPPAAASAPRRSPIDDFPDESTSRRWPKVLGVVAAVVVVLGGLYVGALWLWSDRVPPGTTVAGVEVGGMTADQAVEQLEQQLAPATTEPIAVAMGDTRTTLDPVAAGLGADLPATVEQVTGFGLEPVRLWHQVFGGGAVTPVTTVDRAALTATLEQVAGALATPPVDGTVVFVDGSAESTAAAEGSSVDLEAAEELVVRDWLTAPKPLELPAEVTAPTITDEEVDRVLTEVARPLADAPISVVVGEERSELPAEVVTAAASFAPQDDRLELVLDGEALVTEVVDRMPDLLSEPSNARFVFKDGKPEIKPGTPGTTLDPEALAQAIAAAGTGDGTDRTARVELVETDPEQSTTALEELGVTEVVSSFSTPLNSEPRRTQNIINGAKNINGTLIRPDETFSLTEALGPIDAAHGYVQAGAIVSGEHVDAWGGGLSQISTTTYNAAYFAGFEDVEHHPHSEWFARYPEGREATIFTGTLDMQWRNNTPYGALVQAWVSGGEVHVRIWGTKHWTVETSTSGRSGVVAPTTVYSQSPTCTPQSPGNPGFTVTVTRVLLLDGTEEDRESWTVRYRPQNRVICGDPPSKDDKDEGDED